MVEKGCIPSAGAAEASSVVVEGVVESSSADVAVADGSSVVAEEVVFVLVLILLFTC